MIPLLVGAGIKSKLAQWAVQTSIPGLRAGADVYRQKIDEGATQSEAAFTGVKQTLTNITVATTTGEVLGSPVKEAIGEVTGDVGNAIGEAAVNQVANVLTAGETERRTGHNPGYTPL